MPVHKVGKNQKNKYIAHFNPPISPLKWGIIEFIFLIFHNFSSLKTDTIYTPPMLSRVLILLLFQVFDHRMEWNNAKANSKPEKILLKRY